MVHTPFLQLRIIEALAMLDSRWKLRMIYIAIEDLDLGTSCQWLDCADDLSPALVLTKRGGKVHIWSGWVYSV